MSAAPAILAARRRRRRVRLAGTVAVAAAVVLVALRYGAPIANLFQSQPKVAPGGPTNWMLVAEFDGPPDDPNLAAAVRGLVSAGLDQSGLVTTVSRDQIRLGLQNAGKSDTTRLTPALAQELAVRGGVRTVLQGSIDRVGRGYAVVVRVVDAEDGHPVLTANAAAASDDALITAVNGLTRQLRRGFGEREGEIRATQVLQVFATPSFEAWRKLVEARQRILGVMDPRGGLPLCREALALDPDFGAAWLAMGLAYLNLRILDSAQVCFQEALRRSDRLTREQRLIVEAMLAQTRHDLPAALVAYDRLLEDPGSLAAAAHVNRGWVLNLAGRYEEALDDWNQATRLSPFGVFQGTVGNQLSVLTRLGRLDEARRMLPKVNARRDRDWWSLGVQVAAGDWARAESLASAYQADATTEGGLRGQAALVIGAQEAARGEVRAASRSLERARASAEKAGATVDHRMLRTEVLLAMVSGSAVAQPGGAIGRDTTMAGLITRGLLAVGADDVEQARRLVGAIRARPASELELHGGGPLYLEALIAARAGQWQRVVDLLAPTARQEEKVAYAHVGIGRRPMRWLVGEAYEHLGRLDSAAVYFEGALLQDRLAWEDRPPVRLLSPFAHRKLVLLYARMGRLEAAHRHWKIFSETFTRPDPELRALIAEARGALTSAEGMARSSRH